MIKFSSLSPCLPCPPCLISTPQFKISRLLDAIAFSTEVRILVISGRKIMTNPNNDELRQIVTSLARSVQAMLEQRATDRLKHEERMAFLEENQRQILQTQRGIANLVASLDEDRPTVLRKLNTIENKIDQILENQ